VLDDLLLERHFVGLSEPLPFPLRHGASVQDP
jgi:hypothetical protein